MGDGGPSLNVSAIVVAAGKGSRMNTGVSKQFLPLVNKPILVHTLQCFEHSKDVDEVVLVCGSEDILKCRKLINTYSLSKVKQIVAGGEERQDSVYQGLQAATGEWVLVHDGVRPFLSSNLIDRLIIEVREKEAVVLGVPVKDTIKVVDDNGLILSTPPRKSLWAIQTPQAFRLSSLRKAYEYAHLRQFRGTDDASLMEHMGLLVHVIHGDYENIKITTPEDLRIAEALLRKRGLQ
jgi:2-C-methyl-D-erythritol 4-phosphate cytidylyltransferase